MLQLVSGLQPQFTPMVMLPRPGPLASALEKRNIPAIFVEMGDYTLLRKNVLDIVRYFALLPWLIVRAWQTIYRVQPDLVYANSARTFVWGTLAALLACKPIIWHQHSLLTDTKTLWLLNQVAKLSTVQKIVCVSQTVAEQFPTHSDKISIIPIGVDIEMFCPDARLRQALRADLGIDEDKQVIGIVGDLIPLKGQHTVLQAVRNLSRRARCLVVGGIREGDSTSAAYRDHLYQIAPPNTLFTGYRTDIPAILNAIDILVIASEQETGPLVLLEALSCGVAVASTPVGWAETFLSVDAIFPVHDSDRLGQLLAHWLSHPVELHNRGVEARNLACSRLSVAKFLSAIRHEIEIVMHQKNDF